VGASDWRYVTPYRGDVAAALQGLRERVFRDRKYYWWDDLEEDEPRPPTIDGIWASQQMRESGTHSILDVSRVVTTTEQPDAQFEALAMDVSNPGHGDFINELSMRGAGLYVLLYNGETAADVGFWGYSGD
jgi:hypothetical protein